LIKFNLTSLFKYLNTFDVFSYYFLKKLQYRILDPDYFINLLWILHNSTSRLDNRMMFSEDDPIKIKEYLDETNANVVGTEDYHRFLYLIVRILKPSIMVETGVNEGYSTQAILSAMDLNRSGKLYSIDLPNIINAADLRSYNLNSKEVGYIVPINLRKRWELRFGDSRKLLHPLLKDLGNIDIFLHDSLHTYDHMSYEYGTVWTFLNIDGLLISHDIQMNAAFKKFAQKKKGKIKILNYNIGLIQKTLK